MSDRSWTQFAFCSECQTLYLGCSGEGRFCHHHGSHATKPTYLPHQFARHVEDAGAVQTHYRDLFWKLRDQLHRLSEDWMSDPNQAAKRGDGHCRQHRQWFSGTTCPVCKEEGDQ